MGFPEKVVPVPGRMLRTLLPSFVSDLIWPDQRPNWKLHPTSYLDGLRGIASFIVFFCHYTEENHKYMVPSYGLNPEGQASSWLQLPFFRIVYSGRPMVHIFFIISGFVLSHKPLKALHGSSRSLERCAAALSSSAFRRPFRLFGPCAVSTFLIAIMCQLGWLYQPLPSLSVQLWSWKDAMFHSITWPWSWDTDLRPGYDVHLWTIPIEFAHSMLLFLVILLLARVRLLVRQASTLGLMIYCLCCGKWAAFEFLAGMWLAEIRIAQSVAKGGSGGCGGAVTGEYREGQKQQVRHSRRLLPLLRSIFWTGAIVAAIFVGGWPNWQADRTPGIRHLLRSTPSPFAEMDELAPQKFWFALGALATVWACGELAWARRLLDSSVSQYCGRLSYAIYIVHGPVLEMFQLMVLGEPFVPERVVTPEGDAGGPPRVVPAVPGWGVKGMFGVEGPGQRFMCWLAGLVILLPVAVWAADLFWRLVDMPVIAAARWLENVCLDRTADDVGHAGRNERGYQMTSVSVC